MGKKRNFSISKKRKYSSSEKTYVSRSNETIKCTKCAKLISGGNAKLDLHLLLNCEKGRLQVGPIERSSEESGGLLGDDVNSNPLLDEVDGCGTKSYEEDDISFDIVPQKKLTTAEFLRKREENISYLPSAQISDRPLSVFDVEINDEIKDPEYRNSIETLRSKILIQQEERLEESRQLQIDDYNKNLEEDCDNDDDQRFAMSDNQDEDSGDEEGSDDDVEDGTDAGSMAPTELSSGMNTTTDGLIAKQARTVLNNRKRKRDLDDCDAIGLRLIRLLERSNVSLKLYDEIVKLIHTEASGETTTGRSFDFSKTKLPSRDLLTEKSLDRYEVGGLMPSIRPCYLPGSKKKASLVCHSLEEAIFSMLTDAELMEPDNLLLEDIGDPRVFTNSVSQILGDINTGSVMRDGHKKYCTGPDDVLLGLPMFFDSTSVDKHSRNTLEPMRVTLAIFNYQTRLKPHAWRTIGYLPNAKKLRKSKVTTSEYDALYSHFAVDDHPQSSPWHIPAKARDTHSMIYTILDDLRKIQSAGGLKWNFKWSGLPDSGLVTLKLAVPVLLGDTEGHDKACCLVKGNNSNPLCRCCQIERKDTDNPLVKFEYTSYKKDIVASIERGDIHKVRKKLGYYPLRWNGFRDILFCDDERGLNGALPPEILHFLLLGYYLYGLCGLMYVKRYKKGEAKADETEVVTSKNKDGTTSTDYENKKPNKTSVISVIPDSLAEEFDEVCLRVGRELQKQSCRDLPRTHFPSGGYLPRPEKKDKEKIKTGKKNANEMPGVFLCVLVTLVMADHTELLLERMGEPGLGGWIQILEGLLLMDKWMRKAEFKRLEVYEAKAYFPKFMEKYKLVVNRKEGLGFGFIKFHLLLHVPDDIFRHGAPRNINSGIGEDHHKEDVKNNAKRTQMRAQELEIQTAKRYVKKHALRLGSREADMRCTGSHSVSTKSSTRVRKGTVLTLSWKEDSNGEQRLSVRRVRERKAGASVRDNWDNDVICVDRLLQYIKEEVLPMTDERQSSLLMYTEHKVADAKGELHRYRGHPMWAHGAWHDWAVVREAAGEEGTRLHQVLIWIKIVGKTGGTLSSGVYALTHSVVRKCGDNIIENSLYHGGVLPGTHEVNANSRILHWDAKRLGHIGGSSYEPIINLVESSRFVEPAIGLRDVHSKTKHKYMFVARRSSWPQLFRDTMLDLLNK